MSELAMSVMATSDSPARVTAEQRPVWSAGLRVAFRFFFSYFLLYGFPFPIDRIPIISEVVDRIYYQPWMAIAASLGERLLGHPLLTMENGESDRRIDFVQVFLILIVAVLISAIWSLADRRRTAYVELLAALRVYVRYMLVFPLFVYAAVKIVKIQFPDPEPDALMQMYGDSQPGRLLWMFLGHSYAYCAFIGGAELLAGLLLCFRRTTTLGALIASATLLNVVLVNVFFNVGVKLWSSNLLVMSVFLVAVDARRLTHLLMPGRAAPSTLSGASSAWPPSFDRWLEKRWRRGALAASKVLVIALAGAAAVKPVLKYRKPPPPELFGIYDVESFTRNGELEPLTITDARRWRGAIVNTYGQLTIRFMDDSTIRYRMKTDDAKRTIALSTWDGDTSKKALLGYSRDDADRLTLEGPYGGDKLQVRLHKIERRFRLVDDRLRLFFDGPVESKR